MTNIANADSRVNTAHKQSIQAKPFANLTVNADEAARFLSLLDPDQDRFLFSSFDDDKERAKLMRAKKIEGVPGSEKLSTLTNGLGWMHKRQALGANVCCAVQVMQGAKRTLESVIGYRAIFAEMDQPAKKKWPLKPSIIVESSPGKHHYYWLIDSETPMTGDAFEGIEKRLVITYGADNGAKDRARTLRLPGTWNLKPGRPAHLVTVIDESGYRYTVAELETAFPPVPKAAPSKAPRPEFSRYSGKGDLGRFVAPLKHISPTDYQDWLEVGMALHHESNGSSEGLAIWDAWAAGDQDKWSADECAYRWNTFRAGRGATGGKVFHLAELNGYTKPEKPVKPQTVAKQAVNAETVYSAPLPSTAEVILLPTHKDEEAPKMSVDDFYAVMPTHQYINRHTREMWVPPSVNARVPPQMLKGEPVKATTYLDRCRPVDQLTWAPGQGEVIKDRCILDGGWIDLPGSAIFNLYREPVRSKGNPNDVGPWREHLRKIYPDDADHIEKWLAQRVQRPGEKINHCLVLGGAMGIGKDTILEPVKRAVGPWNFGDVTPNQLLGRFNGFLKSAILRVSEVRDLGDSDRYAFYDHTKTLMAAPPDALRIDEKNAREHMIPNVVCIILTTNNKTHGLYLEADDRRHFVAWSDLTKADFTPEYWNGLYQWYDRGGIENVAAFLQHLDISDFAVKAPPPKTDAFWEIVDSNRPNESNDLADAISQLGTPDALTISQVILHAEPALAAWLGDRKNSRQMPGRLEEAGYVPVRNSGQKDGRWKVNKKNVAIFALKTLTKSKREAAAKAVASRSF